MKTFILTFIIGLFLLAASNINGQESYSYSDIEIASGSSDTTIIDFTKQGDIFYWAAQTATTGESVSTFISKSINGKQSYLTYLSDSTTSDGLIEALPGYFDKNLKVIIYNLGSSEATVNFDIIGRKD